jgi:hypothetical protein
MPRRGGHLRARRGCRGGAAGIVTRMCRDAAGGSVARAFPSRAIEPDRPRTGGPRAGPPQHIVAEQLALEVETSINSRCVFDFWPPCRRLFILTRGLMVVGGVARDAVSLWGVRTCEE